MKLTVVSWFSKLNVKVNEKHGKARGKDKNSEDIMSSDWSVGLYDCKAEYNSDNMIYLAMLFFSRWRQIKSL